MKPTRLDSEIDVWTELSVDWPEARGPKLKDVTILQVEPISGIEEDNLCLVEFAEAYKRQQQYIICPQCKNKIVLNAVR